jgi:small GTP-binding protein
VAIAERTERPAVTAGPTVVIGTAGHIDHGKTSLLRALTGIDADRLPEERERGMTIDVGYAHLTFDDGVEVDFVDVPGHDRLIGNMLVGAGEIDAAMLVVAADDGPRPQTLEHVELLDALGIGDGIAVITKTDLVDGHRAAEVAALVRALLDGTSLNRAPVLPASSSSGDGIDAVRLAIRMLRDAVSGRGRRSEDAGPRLSIDRAFAVKGRGAVVTGTLRGGGLNAGATLRREPGGELVRVREIQVHGAARQRHEGGRTALNLAGISADDLRRGDGGSERAGDRPRAGRNTSSAGRGDGRDTARTAGEDAARAPARSGTAPPSGDGPGRRRRAANPGRAGRAAAGSRAGAGRVSGCAWRRPRARERRRRRRHPRAGHAPAEGRLTPASHAGACRGPAGGGGGGRRRG